MVHVIEGEASDKKEALNPDSQACVDLLEQVLAQAKNGSVTTVGVVACGPVDFGANIAGPNAQGVYLGIGVLRAKIEAAVQQPAVMMAPNILRPGHLPRAPRPVGPGRRG
jgi:hypothetical protein